MRIVLHLIGLYCVADVLRRRIGARTAVVPLVVIGLSPTLLFFNTFQTSFGMDLPYAAICLWLLFSIRFQSATFVDLGKIFLLGMVAMIAAMSYPTFLFYLPSFLILALWSWKKKESAGSPISPVGKGAYLLCGLAGFLLPVGVALLFVREPQLLIYDPINQAGLFRGSGKMGLNATWFKDSVVMVLGDFFVRGRSYYFHLTHPEFSGFLAIISLCWIEATVVYLFIKKKADRIVLFAAFLLLLISFLVPNLSVGGPAGIRRCTGMLAAWFMLFAAVWNFYVHGQCRNIWLRRAGIFVCLLVPLTNAINYPFLLSDVRKPTITFEIGDAAVTWFTKKETPVASLEHFLGATKNGEALSLLDSRGARIPGRYQEIYAAVAGYRLWNHLPAVEVAAWDWKTGTNITLSPFLWTKQYFPR